MTTNDGGPAFSGFEMVDDELMVCGPDGVTRTESLGTKSPRWVQGRLTVLDYFAAAAMQGMLSSDTGNNFTTAQIVPWSIELAEAMLAERERRAAP